LIQTTSHSSNSEPTSISAGLVFSMAMAAGLAVANIYYNQPMLALMTQDFPSELTSYVPTMTQLGYALGLLLLVPLGDVVERKRMICVQFILLAVASIGLALSPTSGLLALSSLALGVAATVAQQIVPLAAHLSPPARRGATIGNVAAGILCGILLSRTLAGFIGTHFGWRQMFWLSAPLSLVASALMAFQLPVSRPDQKMSYGSLLYSLGGLWNEFRSLKLAVFTQAFLFASFTAFWTPLALHLKEPQFGYGADVAGMFGILGAVGVMAAPLAGKISDRRGPRIVIVLGAILTFLSWVVFGLWNSLAGLIIGVIFLDFGVQSSLVSNQHIIYALRPEARGRLNTIFMTGMFIGGAAGSAIAMKAWGAGGWSAVSLIGGIAAALAMLTQAWGARKKAP
jgi:predicted MFS family arabinose efflux permease